jgi:hypothetical protein
MRDEFGGYCCKKWSTKDSCETDEEVNLPLQEDEDGICQLLGLDIDKQAFDLVKNDFELGNLDYEDYCE